MTILLRITVIKITTPTAKTKKTPFNIFGTTCDDQETSIIRMYFKIIHLKICNVN